MLVLCHVMLAVCYVIFPVGQLVKNCLAFNKFYTSFVCFNILCLCEPAALCNAKDKWKHHWKNSIVLIYKRKHSVHWPVINGITAATTRHSPFTAGCDCGITSRSKHRRVMNACFLATLQFIHIVHCILKGLVTLFTAPWTGPFSHAFGRPLQRNGGGNELHSAELY